MDFLDHHLRSGALNTHLRQVVEGYEVIKPGVREELALSYIGGGICLQGSSKKSVHDKIRRDLVQLLDLFLRQKKGLFSVGALWPLRQVDCEGQEQGEELESQRQVVCDSARDRGSVAVPLGSVFLEQQLRSGALDSHLRHVAGGYEVIKPGVRGELALSYIRRGICLQGSSNKSVQDKIRRDVMSLFNLCPRRKKSQFSVGALWQMTLRQTACNLNEGENSEKGDDLQPLQPSKKQRLQSEGWKGIGLAGPRPQRRTPGQRNATICLKKSKRTIKLIVSRGSDIDYREDDERECFICMEQLQDLPDSATTSFYPNRLGFNVVSLELCSKPHRMCVKCFLDAFIEKVCVLHLLQ